MTKLTFDAAAAKAVEAIYMTPDVIAQRARVIDLVAPVPEERILDVGVGPGLLAFDLARLVGEAGYLAGIDVSPAMVTVAATRLAGLPQAFVLEGDATTLAFGDGEFDAAVSTQVYEYVTDVPKALRELHRVLKPGGRTLVLDTDWRSIVWHSSSAALMDRVLACWDAHLADPHLPARLGPMLRAAGFRVRRVEVLPMLSPRWQPVSYSAGMMRSIHNFVREHGSRFGLSPEEIETWRNDQHTLIDRDEFFFSVNRYVFLATR